MESYKQRVPMLEFRYTKPGVNLPRLFEEAPDNLQDLIRNAFDDLQRSELQLNEHINTLQTRNKELEGYASMVAHDLKEPLYAILLMANLITITPGLTPADLKNYMEQITVTAQQMNSTVNALLLFAKVSQANAPLEQVDMKAAVARVLERLKYTIQEHQARIELPATWPLAIGFAPWIEEVWANYLTNALKHGGQPPQVELGASIQADGLLRFWLCDHGPGIPAEIQAQLFSPYHQNDLMRIPSHGMGLLIVRRIIEKLGGQVGCESAAGKGSLFFFTLPADKQSARLFSDPHPTP